MTLFVIINAGLCFCGDSFMKNIKSSLFTRQSVKQNMLVLTAEDFPLDEYDNISRVKRKVDVEGDRFVFKKDNFIYDGIDHRYSQNISYDDDIYKIRKNKEMYALFTCLKSNVVSEIFKLKKIQESNHLLDVAPKYSALFKGFEEFEEGFDQGF